MPNNENGRNRPILAARRLVMLARTSRLLQILALERRPLRFLASRLLMMIPWSRYLTVQREGYVLGLFPTALSASMWADPGFRIDEDRFIRSMLRPGDVMIDVGANIGSVALAGAVAVGPTGYVLAIEPHPRIFSYLKANIARNAAIQVEAVHCALGQRSGEATFSNRRSDDQNSITQDGPIRVPMRRLDDIAPHRNIAFMKVDVEGYEYFVFTGGQETLKRTAVVYFEYVPNLLQTNTAELAWQPLLDAGFEIYEMGPAMLRTALLPPEQETMLIALREAEGFARQMGWTIVAGDMPLNAWGHTL